MAHRIRLRKPWFRRCEVCQPTDTLATGQSRVDVPDVAPTGEANSSKEGMIHRVTYQRRFNRPSRLEPTDSVEVHIESFTGQLIRLRMNETPIDEAAFAHDEERPTSAKAVNHPPTKEIHVDLTEHLLDHNELEITLEGCSPCPRLTGEVNLWIRSATPYR